MAFPDAQPKKRSNFVRRLIKFLAGSQELRPVRRCYDFWINMARRGLFGYDWDRENGAYRLIAVPENPASFEDLPQAVRCFIERIRVTREFAESEVIDRKKIGPSPEFHDTT